MIEELRQVWDSDPARVLEIAGIWIGGLGAIFAAFAALYIASQSNARRVDVQFGEIRFYSKAKQRYEDRVSFDVTNIGHAPVHIKNVGFYLRSKRLNWNAGGFSDEGCVPDFRLEAGQFAQILCGKAVKIEEYDNIAALRRKHLHNIGPIHRFFFPYSVLVRADIATGETFFSTVSGDLASRFLAQNESVQQAKSGAGASGRGDARDKIG